VLNIASRSAPGSPNGSDGGILMESVAGGEAAAGIKRLIQLSYDLSVSRSVPQGKPS